MQKPATIVGPSNRISVKIPATCIGCIMYGNPFFGTDLYVLHKQYDSFLKHTHIHLLTNMILLCEELRLHYMDIRCSLYDTPHSYLLLRLKQ